MILIVVMCDEIRKVKKTVPTKNFPMKIILKQTISTNFNEKMGNL